MDENVPIKEEVAVVEEPTKVGLLFVWVLRKIF